MIHNKWRQSTIAIAALPLLMAVVPPSAGHTMENSKSEAVLRKVNPFPLNSVRLLDGPFKKAMERDGNYLLTLKPDRLLHNFHKFAGLEPKAPIYGGWESQGLAGHTLGHYLSACAMMYASTGDQRYQERVTYIVSELALCQNKNPDGYVGAIPNGDRLWKEVASGDIRAQNFDLNGAWVPWYNLHKLYAGLLDAYTFCGNDQAKTVVTRLGNWAVHVTKNLSEEQWQRMLVAEHGGMNEAMAQLSTITGKPEYLKLARSFNHKSVLDPLAQGKDQLDGMHANTQIPKVIGAARQYELTGEARFREMSEYFWNRVVQDRSYVMGGNSDREHFFSTEQFSRHLGPQTAETCNTYNMLKLTRHLFSWEPSAKQMDFYERALYNHILASQDPEKGMMTYFVALKPGHFKVYNTPEDSFWCCTGSGMENHAKYGESIYFHGADSLYVNLFIPSELTWKEKGIVLRQETRFPEQDTTRLTISCPKPVAMALKVRYPGWARGMTVAINGKPEKLDASPGSYITLSRTWHTSDTVEIRLPMALSLEALPHTPKTVAVLYGPIVLAGTLGTKDLPEEYVPDQRKWDTIPAPTVPLLVSDSESILSHIAPVEKQPLTFRTKGIGKPGDVTLIPFYQLHHQRYNIYWDAVTTKEWKQQESQRAADEVKRKALEARIVDDVRPGEQQSEVDHHMQGESTQSGDFNSGKWRDAKNDGWFSYDLKVLPDVRQVLRCTYWGDDTGMRVFDILIDGEKLTTQALDRNKPGEFFTVDYPLPVERIRNKKKVTVRFQAHPKSIAGGLFGCQILKEEKQ